MDALPQPCGVCVSIVTFAPDIEVLERTLRSLACALAHASEEHLLGRRVVVLVDNGPGEHNVGPLLELATRALQPTSPDAIVLKSGQGNVGYGRGHNLAIAQSDDQYHLILNPDVVLEPDAISEALRFMRTHPDVGFITPAARGPSGETQYLCKRYPSVMDLLLRGFAPRVLRRLFSERLALYEMRDQIGDAIVLDVPIASGSFMFLRREALTAVGGFADAYFMYFEDFDLSVRLGRISRIAYVPEVRITHFGGDAARKGWKHIGMFVRSGATFFSRNGWKWC
ncbi:MAG: glycosyltransferase family 2 protein [Burkholderiales bacterium]